MADRVPLDGSAIRELLEASPAIVSLGIDVEEVEEGGAVVLRMPLARALERAPGSGVFHGGPLASLIDVAGDMAVAVGVGGGVPTIDLRVDYLRPATGAVVRARACVRKPGRTIAVADVEVRDEQGRLCAVGRGCYSARIG